MPCGSSSSATAAGVEAGTTVTVQPRATSAADVALDAEVVGDDVQAVAAHRRRGRRS
jgi:hypothetical protein